MKVDQLQNEVEIDDVRHTIKGELNNIEKFEKFSSDPSEQTGHYVAVGFAKEPEDATIKITVEGGKSKDVVVDDGFLVLKVANPKTQKLKVVATKDEGTNEVVYDLSGLKLL